MTKNKLKKMKRILRYIVAVIFIASGFVKAIDVKGFSFKLEEYFSPDVFNLSFLENYTLEIAVLVVALELVLGLMLLLKMKAKMHAHFVNCIVRFLCISHVLFGLL